MPAEFTQPRQLEVGHALTLLREGTLCIEGQVVAASNTTLYCSVSGDGVDAAVVYKPISGEAPLWDFPHGTLAEREVAAYEVSAAGGWDIVPPTVLREGPAGLGMVQLWIGTDDDADLIGLINGGRSDQLRAMSVFDAVINNSDRKGGHLLVTPAGRIYGVDHGVTFHREEKLRTVLWHWAGAPLTDDAVAALTTLAEALDDDDDAGLRARLESLLTVAEVRQTRRRVAALLESGRHPEPSGNWPAVPWPPI